MTIKDIAKLADVSVSTVSRVLNDRPDVSEDSRRRVRAVIEAHRYVPNNSARDLVKIRSDAVGLVVRGVQNPFYTDIIHAIEQKLDASGYTMVMRQIPSGDDEIQCGAVMEKEKRLREVGITTPRNVYRVGVDLAEDWEKTLLEMTPFATEQRTLTALLGVVYYLPRAAMEALLKRLAAITPRGSSLLFDCPMRDFGTGEDAAGQQRALAKSAGETMQAGVCI